jgi:hypothetical protein
MVPVDVQGPPQLALAQHHLQPAPLHPPKETALDLNRCVQNLFETRNDQFINEEAVETGAHEVEHVDLGLLVRRDILAVELPTPYFIARTSSGHSLDSNLV